MLSSLRNSGGTGKKDLTLEDKVVELESRVRLFLKLFQNNYPLTLDRLNQNQKNERHSKKCFPARESRMKT